MHFNENCAKSNFTRVGPKQLAAEELYAKTDIAPEFEIDFYVSQASGAFSLHVV